MTSRSSQLRLWNWLCIAAVLVNTTLENILVPALPQIRATFSLTGGEAAWLFSLLLITAAVSLPITGRLGDAYGPRRIVVAILGIVNLGVACAAVAQSYAMLLVGVALQGPVLCLMPLAISLLREASSAKQGEEVSSAGLIAAASASTLLGMLLASVVLESWSFRTLFGVSLLVNVPLFGAALLLLRQNAEGRRAPAEIDWLGGSLLGLGLVGLLTGTSMAGTSAPKAALVAAVAMTLLGAALRRFRTTRAPLVDLDLLFSPRIAYAALGQFGTGFGTFGMFIIIPMIVTAAPAAGGLGLSASTVSLCLLPFGVTGLLSPALVPMLRARFSSGFVLVLGSLGLLLAPLVALSATSVVGFGIAAAFLGLGIGVVVTQTFDLIATILPADRVATFSALALVLRLVGNAFGGLVLGIIAGSLLPNAFKWGLTAAAFVMFVPLGAAVALWCGETRKSA